MLNLYLALDVNRAQALDAVSFNHKDRAIAPVNECGFIIAADALFHRLLQNERSGHHLATLSWPLFEAAASNTPFHGKQIDVHFSRHRQHLVCHAVKIASALPGLTPSESRVTALISSRFIYKEAALRLGISPFTVRNHLKNSYAKLGVHNKAALARLLMSLSEFLCAKRS